LTPSGSLTATKAPTTFTGAGCKEIAGLSPESLAPREVVSDSGCGKLEVSSESMTSVRRNPDRKGRAGGQATGTSVKGQKDMGATRNRRSDTLPK
jgi:hypothetical protein